MDRLVAGFIILAVTAFALAAMWWAWRGRVRRAAALKPLTDSDQLASPARVTVEGLYVATTERDAPLERLAISGLAFRGKAGIAVHDDAVVVAVRGEDPVVIATADLRRAGVATWTIDRVVERDGLLFVTWAIGDREVDSYFRILDLAARSRLIAQVERMTVPSGAADREVEE